jgi:hypothetical protein
VGSIAAILKAETTPDDVRNVLDGRRICSGRAHHLDGIAEGGSFHLLGRGQDHFTQVDRVREVVATRRAASSLMASSEVIRRGGQADRACRLDDDRARVRAVDAYAKKLAGSEAEAIYGVEKEQPGANER